MVAGSATARKNLRMGTPAMQRDGQQTEQAKGEQRGIQRKQKAAEVKQHARSHLPHRVCHRRAHADGSVIHHDVGESKHGFGERFDHPQQGCTILRAQPAHGHAKEDGEDRDLENLVVRHRLGDVFGKGVEQHFIPAQRSRLGRLRDDCAARCCGTC